MTLDLGLEVRTFETDMSYCAGYRGSILGQSAPCSITISVGVRLLQATPPTSSTDPPNFNTKRRPSMMLLLNRSAESACRKAVPLKSDPKLSRDRCSRLWYVSRVDPWRYVLSAGDMCDLPK